MSTKRRQWSDESMHKTVGYVREGGGGLREAARLYGVPPETLRRIFGWWKRGVSWAHVLC